MRKRKNLLNLSVAILFLAAMLFAGQVASAQVVVVVNKSNPVRHLSKSVIRQIFLGQVRRIPGTKLIAFPIDLDQHSTVRAHFNKRVIGMSASSLMQYWSKRIFSGKGGPPTVVSSDAEVIRLVSSNVNAIGYVSSARLSGNVKSVLIIK